MSFTHDRDLVDVVFKLIDALGTDGGWLRKEKLSLVFIGRDPVHRVELAIRRGRRHGLPIETMRACRATSYRIDELYVHRGAMIRVREVDEGQFTASTVYRGGTQFSVLGRYPSEGDAIGAARERINIALNKPKPLTAVGQVGAASSRLRRAQEESNINPISREAIA